MRHGKARRPYGHLWRIVGTAAGLTAGLLVGSAFGEIQIAGGVGLAVGFIIGLVLDERGATKGS